MDLSYAQERLTKEFSGIFSADVVIECLEGEAATLGRGARITSYIPILAEHLARDLLRARRPHKAAWVMSKAIS